MLMQPAGSIQPELWCVCHHLMQFEPRAVMQGPILPLAMLLSDRKSLRAKSGAGHATMPRVILSHATSSEQPIVVIDQGRFGFTEFSAPHGPATDALAVTGGVHIVEFVASELACRVLKFPALDPALKVSVLLSSSINACRQPPELICSCIPWKDLPPGTCIQDDHRGNKLQSVEPKN